MRFHASQLWEKGPSFGPHPVFCFAPCDKRVVSSFCSCGSLNHLRRMGCHSVLLCAGIIFPAGLS